jgi:hypothetical protein
MRKIYFLLLTLLISSISYGQGSETFSNSNATSSYSDNSFVGNNGVTWSYVASRDANADANGSGIALPALMLRRVAPDGSKITSSAVAGGVGDFSVKLYKGFTGGGNRQVELFVNGVSRGTSTPFDDFDLHVFTVNGINAGGDVVIEIRNITDKQVIIDDITWTAFAGTGTPTIGISAPTEAQVFNPGTTSVNVAFSTINAPSGSTVDISVNGVVTTNVSSPFPVPTANGQTYNVTVNLMSTGSSVASDMVSFSVASITQVANLGALRADVVANGEGKFYQVMSVPTVTYTRASRNQKYAQDASGGILIDDTAGTITTAFAIGNGMSGLSGQTTSFGGVLQLVPTANATVASSTAVTPEVVTIATLLTNWEDYESELVRINDVTFADAGGTFATSTLYPISASSTMDFRTSFSEADYIGGTIPSGVNDMVVLVAEFNGTPQVTARSLNDLTLSLSEFDTKSFGLYPNPTSLGYVNISSNNTTAMSVAVYDVLGKQILKQTVSNNRLNVASLKSGIYILKISQDNATITKKLVIK